MESLGISNVAALLGLLLLIPIILLYLLNPKPKHIRFPTVMFITRIEKEKRFRSLFTRFIRDPLLLLQILIIIFLVMGLLNPFLVTEEEMDPPTSVVIVIDGSASMQATDIQPDRFSRARDFAAAIIKNINPEGRVSVILAENIPIYALKDETRDQALHHLNKIECGDTPTNIEDALLLAKDSMAGYKPGGKIYVLSDFSKTDKGNLEIAKKLVDKAGINVEFIKIIGDGKNLGITNIGAKRFLTQEDRFYLVYTIRNFQPEDTSVEINIAVDQDTIKTLKGNITGNSERLFNVEGSVSESDHVIEVKINSIDDFPLDDVAYAILPAIRKYDILLIKNEESDIFLKNALDSAPNINLKVAVFPIYISSEIPALDNFDTIFVGEINGKYLDVLPGFFNDLKNYYTGGGNIVFLASSNLNTFQVEDLNSLLPVELNALRDEKDDINVLVDHGILKDVDLAHIVTKKHIDAVLKNNSQAIVGVRNKNTPLLAYKDLTENKVFYLGINPDPEWSNLCYSSSFPVLILQLVKWINCKETKITTRVFTTGDYLPLLDDLNMTSPSGKTLSSRDLILDEMGIYTVYYREGQEKIAVNLADETESEISGSLDVETISHEDYEVKKEKVEVQDDIYPYLIAVAIIILFAEMVMYVRRGKI